MSKDKKKNAKPTAKASAKKAKENEAKKKPVKGIIIAAVALLLAAAIILTVIFVKKNKDSQGGEDVTVPIVTIENEGTQYTYAEYKGSSLPVEFVEILNQAALDSYAACEKYGVALTLGDREISKPEFVLYYYDQYSLQTQEVEYSIQQTGENRTGFDTGLLPDEQDYITSDYETWADEFTEKAIENMTDIYAGFDLAIEAGTKLDVVTIGSVLSSLDRVDSYAKKEGITNDESMAQIYGEGVTAAMFKAREIMSEYAERYQSDKLAELQSGYTEADAEAKLNEDKHAYTLVVGRVYPIEGEYVESEIAKIKTEEDFLSFAQNNYPYEDYDAQVRTQCFFNNRETISSVYGEEVGEWMFSDERKAGDIAVVKGMLFNYLVYVEEPPYLSTSRNVIMSINEYDHSTMTVDYMNELYDESKALYDDWKANDGSKDGFITMSVNTLDEGEITVRAGEYYYMINDWIFDSSRKEGDSTFFNSEVGCCALYYVGNNEDDYDWKVYANETMSGDEFKEMYSSVLDKSYKVKRSDKVIDDAYEVANVSIENYMEKRGY